MAVSKRIYRAYTGPLSPARWRFLVVTRYALGQLFESKIFIALLGLAAIPTIIAIAAIYLANNQAARMLLEMRNQDVLDIDGRFFAFWLQAQGWIAVFMTSYVGPNLVSSDLMHNALPLYLSRPLSRTEYVLGKGAVLGMLLSAVMWIPGLVLFGLEVSLAPAGWFTAHYRIAFAIVAGSLIWIAFLALFSLALSAWVRWRIIATALTFGVFVVPAGMGEVVNAVLRTRWGLVINLVYVINRIWYDLFDVQFRGHLPYSNEHLPIAMVWGTLLAVCALSVWMLDRRLRAREVVRG